MGPKDSYKYDLTNLLVPLIMFSLNHQNHKQWPRWGHVPYTERRQILINEIGAYGGAIYIFVSRLTINLRSCSAPSWDKKWGQAQRPEKAKAAIGGCRPDLLCNIGPLVTFGCALTAEVAIPNNNDVQMQLKIVMWCNNTSRITIQFVIFIFEQLVFSNAYIVM